MSRLLVTKWGSALLLTLVFLGLQAQEAPFKYEVSETKIQRLGQTRSVLDLIEKPSTSLEKKLDYKKNKTAPDNFIGRGHSKVKLPELEHQGPDPVRQAIMGSRRGPEPIVNVDGLNSNFVNDPTGDVGINHYLQAVNATTVGIYEKDGNLVESFSGNVLWAEFNKSGQGDPIVLFDEMSHRWFITEFADPADVLIAISDTEDPLGTYTAYNFSTPSFPDYPKYAIWPNALVFTSNEGGAGNLHNYFIQRDSLLAGVDDVEMQRIAIDGNNGTEAGFYVSTPLDFNGTELPADSLPVVMKINDSSWGGVPEDRLELYTFDIDWDNINNTTVEQTNLVGAPFDSYPCSALTGGFSCVPQLGGGGLDAIPEIVMNVPQYRNFGTHESIVLSFITDATDGLNQSAIRWMELRRVDGEDWSIYQEGTYAPDEMDRFMSSIAIDKNGNIALGYNVSSPNDYVGIRYTGRLADDPLGEMTFEEVTVIDGLNTINSGARFGDYAQMSLDPVDEVTFWYTTEYAGSNGSRTRIVSFKMEKNTYDAAPLEITSPVSSPTLTDSELVSIRVENKGANEIEGLVLGLLLEGDTIETFMVTETVGESQIYEHTFDTPIDMSGIGSYNLGTYTSFEEDEVPQNDVIYTVITKMGELDGSLSSVENIETCNENRIIPFTITNNGANTITEAEIKVTINGTQEIISNYIGSILTGESDVLNITLSDLQEGINEVDAELTSINSSADQNVDNNIISFEVDFEEGRAEYIFNLTLDNWPTETSWSLSSDEGTTIAIGGGYSEEGITITEVFCLEDDMCYIFRIFDSQADGICCNFGLGDYSILDPDGEIVASGGAFGSSESTEFCAGTPCAIAATFEVTDESASGESDGAILVSAMGGIEPYSYSIDGGDTFQDNPLFEGLGTGDYEVVISSDDGACQYMESVFVDVSTSVIDIEGGYKIIVSPNPGEGFYHVKIENLQESGYAMDMQVIDTKGRLIQEMPLQKYNGTFEGDLSLLAYPSGTYYVRFLDSKVSKMARIIKL